MICVTTLPLEERTALIDEWWQWVQTKPQGVEALDLRSYAERKGYSFPVQPKKRDGDTESRKVYEDWKKSIPS